MELTDNNTLVFHRLLLTASSQSAINIAEKAANIVTGFSTLTRKLSTGSAGVSGTRKVGQYGGRRPKTLSVNDQRMSKSTSEPMNLLTDESPGGACMCNVRACQGVCMWVRLGCMYVGGVL